MCMSSPRRPSDPPAPPPPPEPAKAPQMTEALASAGMLRRRAGGVLGTVAGSPLGMGAEQVTGGYKSLLGG
jgi:hypothetical protein